MGTVCRWCGAWPPRTVDVSSCAAPSRARWRCSSCRWSPAERGRPHERGDRHGGSRSFESVAIGALMAGHMSRRGRAVAFLLLALAAAAIAAGDRRRVRVAHRPRLRRAAAGRGRPAPAFPPAGRSAPSGRLGLEVRRVPARFVPPGALSAPDEALGLVPRRPSPPAPTCSPRSCARRGGRAPAPAGLGGGRRPVEIAVSGAGALLAAGAGAGGARGSTSSSPPSRTAAAPVAPMWRLPACRCSGWGRAADGPGPGGVSEATLGLTRDQALRLIAAESFARQVTLLPRG